MSALRRLPVIVARCRRPSSAVVASRRRHHCRSPPPVVATASRHHRHWPSVADRHRPPTTATDCQSPSTVAVDCRPSAVADQAPSSADRCRPLSNCQSSLPTTTGLLATTAGLSAAAGPLVIVEVSIAIVVHVFVTTN